MPAATAAGLEAAYAAVAASAAAAEELIIVFIVFFLGVYRVSSLAKKNDRH